MSGTSNSQFVWPRAGIINERLPKWLCQRLHNLAVKPVHYESSFSGPHNELLHCYFPASNGKMVKPIPRLRKLHWGPLSPAIERDSYDQPVLTRRDDDVPDFVVCNATADLNGDRAFLIWELKRDDASAAKSGEQIGRYEEWLVNYKEFVLHVTGQSPKLWLGLVWKGTVEITEFQVTNPSAPQIISTTTFEVLSSSLHRALEKIRAEYP